jgi:benzodiazapine receptor
MDETSGETVKFRPPAWVFGVVWPILYILLGISWVIASRQNKLNSIIYGLITLLLMSWIIFYSCEKDKKSSVYILICSIMAAFACISVGNNVSKILISPLIGWLIFALMMNAQEIQNN